MKLKILILLAALSSIVLTARKHHLISQEISEDQQSGSTSGCVGRAGPVCTACSNSGLGIDKQCTGESMLGC